MLIHVIKVNNSKKKETKRKEDKLVKAEVKTITYGKTDA
jgi:hypothetical protein